MEKYANYAVIMVRARHYLPIRTLRTVYNAMVYPSTYSSRLDDLYKVQKKILRIVTFSKYQQESIYNYSYCFNCLTYHMS